MQEETKGLIFNIVHGSFVDGYGVRTTIFLKGCPLRCLWCCNPEGQSFEPELKINATRCNSCGRCIPVCKQGALSLDDAGLIAVDRGKCIRCFECMEVCYTDALDRWGTWYTVDEMFEIVQRDSNYYSTSGGGLTIGGGEATWQADFTLELINKCHEYKIPVNIDTCGYVSDPKGIECLRAADMLLFDVKGIDPKDHEKNTGVSNDVIQKNLKMLSDERKPMIIRLPLIPGYNDSEENLKATAELLASLKSVERVDIIPLHQYGKVKYEGVGMEYMLEAEDMDNERQEELRSFFESYGLKTQIGG